MSVLLQKLREQKRLGISPYDMKPRLSTAQAKRAKRLADEPRDDPRVAAAKATKASVDTQIAVNMIVSNIKLTENDINRFSGYKEPRKLRDDDLRCESPTNITMRGSFLIQNQNQSFDKYF